MSSGGVAAEAAAGTPAPEVVVDVRDVTKVYEPSPLWLKFLLRSAVKEPVVALRDVTFQLRAGEMCAVVGPNGAGKSTLFRVLTGLTTPTSGSTTVTGLDSARDSHLVRRIVGFAPADDRSLWLRHTARENLVFHANLQGVARRQVGARVDEMLALVGLDGKGDRVGFALSSGMKARLQLARALLHDPAVLILDEPTGAIDPVGAYELLQTIERITVERRLAVLISSHRLEEIEALHDQILLLDLGEVVFHGALRELRRLWETPRLELRFGGEQGAARAAATLRGARGVGAVDEHGGGVVTVETELPVGGVLGLLDGELESIESVSETRLSLRDVLTQVADRQRERRT